jgi:predicted transcriptional regulator
MDTMSKSTVTFRIDDDKRKALDTIAKNLERDRSAVINEAIGTYLDMQAWQQRHIEQALAEARQPRARFVEHDKVDQWLKSWGSEEEQTPPEAALRRS